MTDSQLIALIFVFVSVVLLTVFWRDQYPYQTRGTLLTKAEMNFYRQIAMLMPPGTVLFSKVRIADVMEVRENIKGKVRSNHFREIAAKHLDFVVVDAKDTRILFAIELNDSSHNQRDRKERDAFVRRALDSSNIPLLEVKARRKYNTDELRAVFLRMLSEDPRRLKTVQVDAKLEEESPELDSANTGNKA